MGSDPHGNKSQTVFSHTHTRRRGVTAPHERLRELTQAGRRASSLKKGHWSLQPNEKKYTPKKNKPKKKTDMMPRKRLRNGKAATHQTANTKPLQARALSY